MTEPKRVFRLHVADHPTPQLSIEHDLAGHSGQTAKLDLPPEQAWALAHDMLKAMREKFGMVPPTVDNPVWRIGVSPEMPGAVLIYFEHPYYGKLTFVYPPEEFQKWKKAFAQVPVFAPFTETKQ